MVTAVASRLSDRQIAFYNTEGYLLYDKPVFPKAEFDALRDHFEEKLTRLPEGYRPEAMDVPHFTDPALFRWLLSDAVLDLVEPLIGPDIALWSSHFICKPANTGRRVPWHEDSFYWSGLLEPMKVVTVWLAIDPATTENGCMKIIPRTQHNGYSDYDPVPDPEKQVFGAEIRKFQVDEARAVPCVLEPNHCSLHDGKLIHGSDPNQSETRRCGYTMRYVPTNVKLNAKKDGHQFYLARGKAHVENNYGDPTQSYPHLARYRETHKGNFH